jgi:hypothetical protein
MSLIYNKNNNGESTNHWGTPALTRPESESSLFTNTNCLLSHKYFLYQIKRSPDIPHDFSFLISSSCQTQKLLKYHKILK